MTREIINNSFITLNVRDNLILCLMTLHMYASGMHAQCIIVKQCRRLKFEYGTNHLT